CVRDAYGMGLDVW
nr:immunoglobulin heavy chain junction region [Macaca mulatta]MOY18096.1 immunoglobulin heavy chain junction region [Macaca mulatta]MOY18231.1 immunoglobulin heavy chain junction region [Macaca mulatta]MOY18468.1 immunoglobulin heavy chain junction region [Macaca mulatta]MOY18530.1 immunoglobulin heavy chain junction region [Macaca mulatta]